MQGSVKPCNKIVGTPLNDLHDLYRSGPWRRWEPFWLTPVIPCGMNLRCCHPGAVCHESRCRTNRKKNW